MEGRAVYMSQQLQELYHIVAQPLDRRLDIRSAVRDGLDRYFGANRPSAAYAGPRLSMPEISDDSGSEPDLSVLGMVRGVVPEQPALVATYEDEIMSQEPDEDDDTSLDEQSEAEQDEGEVEDDEESPPLVDPTTVGLKEISNLGKFTVSSHKQGSGVEELRSDDLKLYWQ